MKKFKKVCSPSQTFSRLLLRKQKERGERIIHEERLIKKILAGNQQAMRVLIETYRQHVFNITYSVLRDPQEAEDIAQETFIKLMDALPTYQFQGFKTWLGKIALNKAIDYKRKKQRAKEDLIYSEKEFAIPTMGSTEDQVVDHFIRRRVRDAIGELPETLRLAVWYYYIEDLSYQEISKKLSIEESTVKMRLYRARKWMKTNWKEEDFSWNT
ncbi:RNA polymerase sigma factor [Radiobacillus kanasensis]|uniref:RNA polymerase sigma factor n=1 Tax=Radiobacillus kanasensis TaxID=2844358 RepID=UPI001E5EC780|nr:RNA polymerase sigma factor [Radiobacillus kanasensis]UFU00003.1 RNA polymerase sigma factor [Radiobacillus kanasensis]